MIGDFTIVAHPLDTDDNQEKIWIRLIQKFDENHTS